MHSYPFLTLENGRTSCVEHIPPPPPPPTIGTKIPSRNTPSSDMRDMELWQEERDNDESMSFPMRLVFIAGITGGSQSYRINTLLLCQSNQATNKKKPIPPPTPTPTLHSSQSYKINTLLLCQSNQARTKRNPSPPPPPPTLTLHS